MDRSLFERLDAEFVSDYEIADSVLRLGACVKHRLSETLFHEGLVGSVEAARVTFYHHNPWYRSRGMHFLGVFSDGGGHAVLRGSFSMGSWGVIFWIFFGLFALAAWLALLDGAAAGSLDEALGFALGGVVIWALFYTSVRVTGRGDIQRMTHVIREALKKI